MIFTIEPPLCTALAAAPVPFPVIATVGLEVYPVPAASILNPTICLPAIAAF